MGGLGEYLLRVPFRFQFTPLLFLVHVIEVHYVLVQRDKLIVQVLLQVQLIIIIVIVNSLNYFVLPRHFLFRILTLFRFIAPPLVS